MPSLFISGPDRSDKIGASGRFGRSSAYREPLSVDIKPDVGSAFASAVLGSVDIGI